MNMMEASAFSKFLLGDASSEKDLSDGQREPPELHLYCNRHRKTVNGELTFFFVGGSAMKTPHAVPISMRVPKEVHETLRRMAKGKLTQALIVEAGLRLLIEADDKDRTIAFLDSICGEPLPDDQPDDGNTHASAA